MKEFLRSLLHAALDAVLRSRSRAWLPAADSRCLIIAPHPDDEVLGCANLIQRQAVAGRPVEIVYLTNGAASHPDHPRLGPAEIGRMRQAEARCVGRFARPVAARRGRADHAANRRRARTVSADFDLPAEQG